MILDIEENTFAPEAPENPERIGNISKPKPIHCLPACTTLDFPVQTSYSVFPQRENFFYQKDFCITASHILQATCKPDKFFSHEGRIGVHRKEFLSVR